MMIAWMSAPVASSMMAFAALTAALPSSSGPVGYESQTPSVTSVPNSRIVILAPGADPTNFRTFMQDSMENKVNGLPTLNAVDGAQAPLRVLKKEFGADDMAIFTGDFDDEFTETLKNRSDVLEVLENKIHHIYDKQRSPPSYGLTRISERDPPKNSSYSYSYPRSGGAGVTVYVVDTGFRLDHEDYKGRTKPGMSSVDGVATADDDNGHGTHVAAIIGGTKFGVAKKSTLVPVKVCSKKGACMSNDIMEGIIWVINDAKKYRKGKVIVNLSLGGPIDKAIDYVVEAGLKAGLAFAVAAGNDAKDACNSSPARVSGVVTVGAIDANNHQATYSNFGSCVDIFAPGTQIKSAWNVDNKATHTMSGTSMSSPFVAGTMALYASAGVYTNVQLSELIIKLASHDDVVGIAPGTPNLIVYNNGEELVNLNTPGEKTRYTRPLLPDVLDDTDLPDDFAIDDDVNLSDSLGF